MRTETLSVLLADVYLAPTVSVDGMKEVRKKKEDKEGGREERGRGKGLCFHVITAATSADPPHRAAGGGLFIRASSLFLCNRTPAKIRPFYIVISSLAKSPFLYLSSF